MRMTLRFISDEIKKMKLTDKTNKTNKMPRWMIWSKAITFTTAFLMAVSKKKIHW